MNRFHPSRFLILLSLALLGGVSGCSGVSNPPEIFPSDRFRVTLMSTDVVLSSQYPQSELRDVPIEDIPYLCRSSSRITRLCWLKARLPAGQVDNLLNNTSVFPQNVVVPGFVSIPHTIENGRATVLLLQVPPKQ